MKPRSGSVTTVVFVPAMDCPDEEREIRAALARLPSVESLDFRLFARQVQVVHEGPVEPILEALRRIGMEGRPVDETLRKADLPPKDSVQWRTLLLAGAALLLGILLYVLLPGEPLARETFRICTEGGRIVSYADEKAIFIAKKPGGPPAP